MMEEEHEIKSIEKLPSEIEETRDLSSSVRYEKNS